MAFPVLKNLEIGVSVRYDDYSDFGGTTNPKIAAQADTPIQHLLLRGSYNTGFARADAGPTCMHLRTRPPSPAAATTTRCCARTACPILQAGAAADARLRHPVPAACRAVTRSLQPEESDAWTIGFVPAADAAVVVRRRLLGLHGHQQHQRDRRERRSSPTPNKYANLFVRCSAGSGARARRRSRAASMPGGDPLAYIINTNLNLGDTKTNGLRLPVQLEPEAAPSTAASRVNWRGTYVTKYEFQIEPSGSLVQPGRQLQRPVRWTGAALPARSPTSAGHGVRGRRPSGTATRAATSTRTRPLRCSRRSARTRWGHGRCGTCPVRGPATRA
ncbi:MAG: TonB-dependent receptor [Comamonadaceae bacterium]|nr:TonB-dependent receptor [Comamonadaceae bacterium]